MATKTTFKQVKNEVTGKIDLNFAGKLLTLGKEVRENSNKTKYVLGTLGFTYPSGAEAVVTTQIFEKNLQYGLTVGDTYLSTMSQDDEGNAWVRTSHLVAGNGVSLEEMGSLFAMVDAVPAKEVAVAP